MDYFVEHNENPQSRRVGDCVVRAISTALGQNWDKTFLDLCVESVMYCDMPSSNAIWGSYLKDKGYKRNTIPNDCDCYTVENFCKDHPKGTYILGTGSHAICVKDGKFYDVWNSKDELPIYYFMKDEE